MDGEFMYIRNLPETSRVYTTSPYSSLRLNLASSYSDVSSMRNRRIISQHLIQSNSFNAILKPEARGQLIQLLFRLAREQLSELPTQIFAQQAFSYHSFNVSIKGP